MKKLIAVLLLALLVLPILAGVARLRLLARRRAAQDCEANARLPFEGK